MLKEFKAFIMRGNVLDLAVAVIIGGAFGTIVNSLVKDIIMPPIGLLLGRINFTDLFISLNGKPYDTLKIAQEAGAPTLNYGIFIQAIINFLIIGFVIFLLIKAANAFQKKEETPKPPATKECPYCFSTISIKAVRCSNCTSELNIADNI